LPFYKGIEQNILYNMISLTKGFNMKMFKLVSLVAVAILFTACARHPKAVALNMYNPQKTQHERISGETVVITQAMINTMRQRKLNK